MDRFSTDDELKYTTEVRPKEQSELLYFTGIRKIRNRKKLRCDKGGNYVEKEMYTYPSLFYFNRLGSILLNALVRMQ